MSMEQELLKAQVKAERWKIAYEVLERQWNEASYQNMMEIDHLQTVIANLLRERHERLDKLTETTSVDNW